MKNLPIGIQNFRKIIEGDFVYVDKTQYIYNLLNDVSYSFLSRPRRFGKSLLLDTIGEVFNGDKELFKGLWIYNSDYDFIKCPVIRIDMSNIANKTPDALENSLSNYLQAYYASENVTYKKRISSDEFMNLIVLLYNKYKQRLVILIDEYDKPILDHIDDIKTASGNRQVLKGFYGILKSMDRYLKFTLLTGVTKFTKTSIFSGLNNLLDISMMSKYAGICGIPVECLDEVFGDHIERLKSNESFKQYASISDEILAWYDGYSWDGKNRLLNPFSLLSFFKQEKFKSHWYSTGTPGFLIDMIKKEPESYLELNNVKISEEMLDTFDIEDIVFESLLFQTGYLTVKEVIQRRGSPVYILDIPNYEVRDSFNMQVLSALSGSGEKKSNRAKMEIGAALESGDLHKMLEILRGLFASIPYELHVNREAYYHSIFYAAMTLLGFDTDVEVSVSRGRVDAVLELDDKSYILEFKYVKCSADANEDEKQKLLDAALTDAMNQINDRGYGDKYKGGGKTVYKAAFAFLGRDDIEIRVERG